MNWIETPWGDKYHNYSKMAYTKATPRRVTPGSKYTMTERMRTQRRTRTNARRALFAVRNPYVTRRVPTTQIGFPTGTGTGYRANTVNKWTAITSAVTSKSIISDNVVAIARQTTGNEINLRERDMINCLGFSLRVNLINTNTLLASTVRMALVSPLDKNEINDVEFFRGYADRRTIDFDPTLDSSVLLFNSVNRDNYAVLWEKKITLGTARPETTTVNVDRTVANYTSFSTYIPLRRQLRYDGPSQNQCSENIFLLMWYDSPQGEGTTAASQYVNYRRYVVTHWKNPGQA